MVMTTSPNLPSILGQDKNGQFSEVGIFGNFGLSSTLGGYYDPVYTIAFTYVSCSIDIS
jgi:hypothetical protein